MKLAWQPGKVLETTSDLSQQAQRLRDVDEKLLAHIRSDKEEIDCA